MSEVNVNAEEFRVVTVEAAESLDRVTAERDAALESIVRLNDKVSCMSAHVLAYKLSRQRLLGRARTRELLISELQQRLTAADERADVLEGLLRRTLEYFTEPGMPEDLLAEFKAVEGIDHRDMAAKVQLMKREGGDHVARLALRPENQRITPSRFKCLACGEYHEGSGNLPCPSMSPYSRIEQ